jgi:hypothetical protein
MNNDPLIELLHAAEQSCETTGQMSIGVALRSLQTVLREDAELSRELRRRIGAAVARDA